MIGWLENMVGARKIEKKNTKFEIGYNTTLLVKHDDFFVVKKKTK